MKTVTCIVVGSLGLIALCNQVQFLRPVHDLIFNEA
jgi:hypothetical protein